MISIIIPAFNVEKNIEQTLNSVINQSYTDWEVIAVNDGSSDRTEDILKRYCNVDCRIRYKTIPNSGAAHFPRLEAASLAKGEYICNIDADDYIEDNYLEMLLKRLEDTKVDLVCGQMVYLDTGVIHHYIPKEDFDFSQILTGRDAAFLTFKVGAGSLIGTDGMLCKKHLYTELISERFSTPNNVYQDEIDCMHLLLRASKVAFCKTYYYYITNQDSITHRVSAKKYDKLITEIDYKNLIKANFLEKEKKIAANNRFVNVLIGRRFKYLAERSFFSETEKKYIAHNFRVAFCNVESYTVGKQKILISFGYNFFCFITYILYLLRKK